MHFVIFIFIKFLSGFVEIMQEQLHAINHVDFKSAVGNEKKFGLEIVMRMMLVWRYSDPIGSNFLNKNYETY